MGRAGRGRRWQEMTITVRSGNPYRGPDGRFTTALAYAASRRLVRLIQLGDDLNALERRDPVGKLEDPDGNEVEVETAALTILHAHVNRVLEVTP
jgi:hypothetical protein